MMVKNTTAELGQRLLRDWVDMADGWTGELTTDFRIMGRQAASAYRTVADETGVDFTAKQLDDDEALAEIVMQRARLAGLRTLDFGRHFLRVARRVVDRVNSALGIGASLPDRLVRQVLAEGGTRLGLLDLPRQTRASVFRAIQAGRAEGLGTEAIARSIAGLVERGPWGSPETRARVIAVTETRHAQNYAVIETSRINRNVRALMIIDAQGGATDERCESRNGDVVTFEEAPTITEHPNGTLGFVPLVGALGLQRIVQ